MVGEAQQAKRRATASNETQANCARSSQSAPFSAPDPDPLVKPLAGPCRLWAVALGSHRRTVLRKGVGGARV